MTTQKPVCAYCGSDSVVLDAWACWNTETQDWDLATTFDDAFCNGCDKDTSLSWVETTPTETVDPNQWAFNRNLESF